MTYTETSIQVKVVNTVQEQEIVKTMRERGVTPTQQRIDIARILFDRPQHVSADQVLQRANLGDTKVSKATVYNTLNLFVEKGLVSQVIVDPTRVFYDPVTTPHHHFYNVDTGELSDIDAQQVKVTEIPSPPPNTTQVGVDVIIRIKGQNS